MTEQLEADEAEPDLTVRAVAVTKKVDMTINQLVKIMTAWEWHSVTVYAEGGQIKCDLINK